VNVSLKILLNKLIPGCAGDRGVRHPRLKRLFRDPKPSPLNPNTQTPNRTGGTLTQTPTPQPPHLKSLLGEGNVVRLQYALHLRSSRHLSECNQLAVFNSLKFCSRSPGSGVLWYNSGVSRFAPTLRSGGDERTLPELITANVNETDCSMGPTELPSQRF